MGNPQKGTLILGNSQISLPARALELRRCSLTAANSSLKARRRSEILKKACSPGKHAGKFHDIIGFRA